MRSNYRCDSCHPFDGLPPVSIDIATGVATEGRLGVTTTFGTLHVTDTDG